MISTFLGKRCICLDLGLNEITSLYNLSAEFFFQINLDYTFHISQKQLLQLTLCTKNIWFKTVFNHNHLVYNDVYKRMFNC